MYRFKNNLIKLFPEKYFLSHFNKYISLNKFLLADEFIDFFNREPQKSFSMLQVEISSILK